LAAKSQSVCMLTVWGWRRSTQNLLTTGCCRQTGSQSCQHTATHCVCHRSLLFKAELHPRLSVASGVVGGIPTATTTTPCRCCCCCGCSACVVVSVAVCACCCWCGCTAAAALPCMQEARASRQAFCHAGTEQQRPPSFAYCEAAAPQAL
jgi:hypothetical protein